MRPVAIVAALVGLSVGTPALGDIILDFPSEDSTTFNAASGTFGTLGGGGGGVFFVEGTYVEEVFLDTGRDSVDGSHWVFQMDDWTDSGVVNTFDVLINEVVVGDFSFVGVGVFSTIVDVDLDLAHAVIAGDDYTLKILATSTVPPGLASWNWLPGGTVTLSSVPGPGTLALLGLAGLGVRRRR